MQEAVFQPPHPRGSLQQPCQPPIQPSDSMPTLALAGSTPPPTACTASVLPVYCHPLTAGARWAPARGASPGGARGTRAGSAGPRQRWRRPNTAKEQARRGSRVRPALRMACVARYPAPRATFSLRHRTTLPILTGKRSQDPPPGSQHCAGCARWRAPQPACRWCACGWPAETGGRRACAAQGGQRRGRQGHARPRGLHEWAPLLAQEEAAPNWLAPMRFHSPLTWWCQPAPHPQQISPFPPLAPC